MVKSKNIRELTKKEKVKGITIFAWQIIFIMCSGVFPHIHIFVIPLALALYVTFFVLEYFDDDFIEIIKINLSTQLRKKNEFYS
jgi:type IV secretory pathway VirB3-like protein